MTSVGYGGMAKLLEHYPHTLDFSNAHVHGVALFEWLTFESLMLPGINGIPILFGKLFAPKVPACYTARLWPASGRPMCLDFNNALNVFPARGEEPDGCLEVRRGPTDTRPFGLNNTDNNLVVGATKSALKPPVRQGARRFQNGSMSGRSFLRRSH